MSNQSKRSTQKPSTPEPKLNFEPVVLAKLAELEDFVKVFTAVFIEKKQDVSILERRLIEAVREGERLDALARGTASVPPAPASSPRLAKAGLRPKHLTAHFSHRRTA